MGREWDVSGMVEGYSIDGPQAPSNAFSLFLKIDQLSIFKKGTGGDWQWERSGMVEGYAIDGPQAPSNAHSFFENRPMIDFQRRIGGDWEWERSGT